MVTIFRATSNSKLKEVYEEIDKLEKTKLNVKEYSKRQEDYRWFALAAFLMCIAGGSVAELNTEEDSVGMFRQS